MPFRSRDKTCHHEINIFHVLYRLQPIQIPWHGIIRNPVGCYASFDQIAISADSIKLARQKIQEVTITTASSFLSLTSFTSKPSNIS